MMHFRNLLILLALFAPLLMAGNVRIVPSDIGSALLTFRAANLDFTSDNNHCLGNTASASGGSVCGQPGTAGTANIFVTGAKMPHSQIVRVGSLSCIMSAETGIVGADTVDIAPVSLNGVANATATSTVLTITAADEADDVLTVDINEELAIQDGFVQLWVDMTDGDSSITDLDIDCVLEIFW